MSVFKTKASPYYQYDFQFRGKRFCGTTKETSERKAQQFERIARERAADEHRAQLAREAHARATGQSVTTQSLSLRLNDIGKLYFDMVGQHHVAADDTLRKLAHLSDFFGGDKSLATITDDDVARLVAWRRSHRVQRGDKPLDQCPLISAYTVNDTTEQLKKLFNFAIRSGANLKPLNWKVHFLKEPEERVRELRDDEKDRLDAEMRADYRPIFQYAHLTGRRMKECLIRWSEVDFTNGLIVKVGKGGRRTVTPLSPAVLAIIEPLRGHHPEFVFTYVTARTIAGNRKVGKRTKGERRPITVHGLKAYWSGLRKRAKVAGFRFHDFRHDFGTKMLRQTGNLKLVQRLLGHQDIATTSRYAHVMQDDLIDALQMRAAESRKKSRIHLKLVKKAQ